MNRAMVIGLVAAALGVSLSGCSSGDAGEEPFSETKFYGSWAEQEIPVNPRAMPEAEATRNLRQITINQDKTFKLVMHTPGGGATSEACEGTWEVAGESLKFTVTNNTLGAKIKNDYVPVETTANDTDTDGTPRISIRHADGKIVMYLQKK